MRLLSSIAVVTLAAAALAACQPEAAANDRKGPAGEAAHIPIAANDFQTPVDLVETLYAEPAIPAEPAAIRRFFVEEMVPGMTQPEDDVGLIDFDYRIGGQDGEARNLRVEEVAGGPNGGVVVARFDNYEAQEVTWTVCRQPDGRLRIVEVSSNRGEGWSIRQVLGLPPRGPGC